MNDIKKTAMIAIVGRPNVGKSTLTNALVGEKVAIVSSKPQTTRNRICGVVNRGETQFVLLDTPGLHKARTRLGDYMVKVVRQSVADVDGVCLLVEPIAKIGAPEQALIDRIKEEQLPAVLVLNKIDTLKNKDALLECIAVWQEAYAFDEVYPVSALTGEGVPALEEHLRTYAFESPHFFPDDAVSDQTEQAAAAELIREKMLLLLRDEIPHGVAVVVECMGERAGQNGPVLDIEATIFCERESHKGIIIGKRGAMLRQIGTQAREDLERLFGVKVNLQCWVKVKEDWRNRQGLLGQFGYRT